MQRAVLDAVQCVEIETLDGTQLRVGEGVDGETWHTDGRRGRGRNAGRIWSQKLQLLFVRDRCDP